MSDQVAVFFDIGDTLGHAVVDAGRLARIELFPFVPEVLGALRAGGRAAVGLISNTGDESAERLDALVADAGLDELVDDGLRLFSSVEGLDKTQSAFFRLARDRAAVSVERCVFVGENADERDVAESAGFRVSPHPLHALHLVRTAFAAPSVTA